MFFFSKLIDFIDSSPSKYSGIPIWEISQSQIEISLHQKVDMACEHFSTKIAHVAPSPIPFTTPHSKQSKFSQVIYSNFNEIEFLS